MKNKKKIIAKRIIIKIWPRILRNAIHWVAQNFPAWRDIECFACTLKLLSWISWLWGKNMFFDPLHLNQWNIYVGRYVSVVVKWVSLPKTQLLQATISHIAHMWRMCGLPWITILVTNKSTCHDFHEWRNQIFDKCPYEWLDRYSRYIIQYVISYTLFNAYNWYKSVNKHRLIPIVTKYGLS